MYIYASAEDRVTMVTMTIPYLDGSGSGGKGDQGTGSLVAHSRGRGGEEVVDAADEAGTLSGIGMAHLGTDTGFHTGWVVGMHASKQGGLGACPPPPPPQKQLSSLRLILMPIRSHIYGPRNSAKYRSNP